jgi:hypothetical protein
MKAIEGRSCAGGIGALAALVLVSSAWAADEPYHVRGMLGSVTSDGVAVNTDAGEALEVALKGDTRVLVVTPASLDDVKQGDYVGITSVERGGERVALGMHIFAEDLKGTAEGHVPWDLVKESNTMTNATVAEVADVSAGRELMLTYRQKDGEQGSEGSQTIVVPEDLEIARLSKAPDRSVLEADRQVFMIVKDMEGDTPTALAVVVESEGATPPM